MDENNIHTSVVIEIANQEGPEEQNTYQIDFDDLDEQKDYILDQVSCGESVTVYAIIELPEEPKKQPQDNTLQVANSQETYRFLHKNSLSKKNGCQENSCLLNPKEPPKNIIKNENLYSLKHVSGDFEMLTTEKSDLKVLYNKTAISKPLMLSTPFKTVSKGVNTDIVQSPRIIQEVQKAVKVPLSKSPGSKTLSSKKSSYEVIEMEMRQSFSSLSSFDSKTQCKSSIPNFFIVPLLMMEDGVLSHFQKSEKMHAHSGDSRIDSTSTATSGKVSIGTNTKSPDMKKPDPAPMLGNETDSHHKLTSKSSILNEIKNLQGKLNSLIKSIELNDFDFDEKPDETTILNISSNIQVHQTSETALSNVKTNVKNYDDLPIFSSLTFPELKKSEGKKKQTEEEISEISVTPKKSISADGLPILNPSKSQIFVTDGEKSREELIQEESCINWDKLESRRGAGLSKSATEHSLDSKNNCTLKKSLSFACKNEKLEMYYLKKTKNNQFKLEIKSNSRICQKGEPNLKCEMGDEAFNKLKASRVDLNKLSQAIEKLESLHRFPNKILLEEEGDAKSVYSKQNLYSQMLGRKSEKLEVHFCNTNTRRSENILSSEKSILPQPVKSKPTYPNLESAKKATIDSEKPSVPNKSIRKGHNTNQNPKKEIKTIKKQSNQSCANNLSNKIREKGFRTDLLPSQELIKHRSLMGSRKFTLRGTAESKLHVDRLMRQVALNKPTNSERAGAKRDCSPRLQCHPSKGPVIDCDKEKIDKVTKVESFTVLHKNAIKENSECAIILESQEVLETKPMDSSSSYIPNVPGIVVEVFSEKPPVTGSNSVMEDFVPFDENVKIEEGFDHNLFDLEQGGVKSLWALTKVLLVDDGSKKIEILEASLTPPGSYSS